MEIEYDINNRKMLRAGAGFQARQNNHQEGGWRPMTTAPRDGTYVELKNTYGVAPSYCIARWTDEQVATDGHGNLHPFKADAPSWTKPEGGGPFSEHALHWRPYLGEISSYVDPTGGAQNSPAYWRGAVAAKHGLPLDYFEEQVARNVSKGDEAAKPARSWWRRLFD